MRGFLFNGLCALSLFVVPVMGAGCAVQAEPEPTNTAQGGSDGPIASTGEALTANNCPGPTMLGSQVSATSTPPDALPGLCEGSPGEDPDGINPDESLSNQYNADGQRADLGGQCEAYCSQSLASCASGWSLTQFAALPPFTVYNTNLTAVGGNLFDNQATAGQSATCYNRDAGHRWLVNCTCR